MVQLKDGELREAIPNKNPFLYDELDEWFVDS